LNDSCKFSKIGIKSIFKDKFNFKEEVNFFLSLKKKNIKKCILVGREKKINVYIDITNTKFYVNNIYKKKFCFL